MRKIVTIASLCLASLAPSAASASFHLIKIVEVFGGTQAAPNAQYIELQMFSSGQNFLGGQKITVFGSANNAIASFTFPAGVTNGANQSTILIATSQAASF